MGLRNEKGMKRNENGKKGNEKSPRCITHQGLKSSFNYFMKTQPSEDGCL